MKNIIRTPKSKFIVVLCKKCKTDQIIYNRAATKIFCLNCKEELANPTGGVAHVKGKILQSLS